jgi:Mce-associated membrane protein
MPPRKRTSSLLNGDADVEPDDIVVSNPVDALSLAEEAEAEAAEAEAVAAAARAKARALRLRSQAKAATAVARTPNGTATPRNGLQVVAAGLVLLLSLGLFGFGGWMIWHHNDVVAEQQRSAEFVAAARQGVVTLMSLDFNHAEDDVKRIIDTTTGDFRKDFESQVPEFTKATKQSKVVTEATVNAAAVQSMTKDTATVLIAVTTRVSNVTSKQQEPRSWRLSVDVVRDGGQVKLAKVEFVS